ncbi:UDP-2,3-diacylglucosamine diphosphatase [Methylotenera sp. 1P/1]|jgi:UDP-2,3-diacylglucosamine hydrolase|uniref:UDP-2,3-diacylglucosamine diphosphatase n=1 Tax=Methylotenera sp. 1P/1 TaxID=1131551 RepID=UPI00036CEF33|nr:UDP-2,3-diacylglucosamine diphosphatase [Methylotenera sp. 1P/1]
MQGDTLFISDLHLCESRPNITSVFLVWLAEVAAQADALYILGDFFEYWAGDDAMQDDFHRPILHALHQLTQQNTQVYLMHGNRDFLIREAFSQATGVQLIADPLLTVMHGQRILLTHGDALCTDDVSYIAFREQVRHPAWQSTFLSQSLAERKAFIAQARARSEVEKSQKESMIMDVNADAVAQLVREHDFPPVLIHGHTHRPNRHAFNVDGHACERWVLGDWYEQGSYLKMDNRGHLVAETIPT